MVRRKTASNHLRSQETTPTAFDDTNLQKLLKDENSRESVVDNGANFFSFFSHGIQEKNIHNEMELVNKYREYSEISEVEECVDLIANEAVVSDGIDPAVKMKISKSEIMESDVYDYLTSEALKSFHKLYEIMNFDLDGDVLFKRWYVDGRLYLYVDFDEERGIKDVYYLDCLRITKMKNKQGEIFYRYTLRRNLDTSIQKFFDIPADNIVFIDSGILGKDGLVLGSLNKAIRPVSSLKMIENSLIIGRLVRSPERFVFRINTKGLNDKKALEYLESMKRNYKSRFYVDNTTGEIKGEAASMALVENFYFAQDMNGNGHNVEILKGTTGMSDTSDIMYFYKKMYRSLNVPMSRFQDDKVINFSGRKDEIDSEELNFFKFIKKRRSKFVNPMFEKLMRLDMIIRRICSYNDFKMLRRLFQYIYNNDNKYEQQKEYQKIQAAFDVYPQAKQTLEEGYEDIYWFYKTVFGYTKEETDDCLERMEKEIVRQGKVKQLRIKAGLARPVDFPEETKDY